MPLNKTVVIPAPQGMDANTNPALLPPSRAVRIQNFRADAPGRLRASMQLLNVGTFASPPDGVAFYYGLTAEDNRLLVIEGGNLHVGIPYNLDRNPPQWSFSVIGGGFQTGKRVRSVSFDQETFFVQEGGIQPKRYDGTGLFQLGITPPENAPVVLPMTPTDGSDNKSGTIRYYYSYFDSRFRESDLSPYASIDYSAYSGYCGQIVIDYGNDPQVYGAYIYATVAGVTDIRYRIATLYKHLGQYQYEDDNADAIVQAGVQAPDPGQFAIPNPASIIAVHKRHIVLNDTTDPNALQINNLDAPTQWATVTGASTDGGKLDIGTHQGAGINALLPIGSLLLVCTRAEITHLWGDNMQGNLPFQLRSLQNSVGVLAPSSLLMCTNAAVGLMSDGKIYLTGGADNFLVHELSQEIDPLLREHSAEERENAVAAFSENCYILFIGERGYCYDFTAKGWTIIEGLTTEPIIVPLVGGGIVNINTQEYLLALEENEVEEELPVFDLLTERVLVQ